MDTEQFNKCLSDLHNGKMSSIEQIYNEYYEKMVMTAWQILRDRYSAEDAASDTMLKIIEFARSAEFRGVQNPGAYMYVMVKNTAMDSLRKRKRTVDIDDLVETAATNDSDGIGQVSFKQFMGTLKGRRRRVAEMYCLYNYTSKEISERENVPEGTVKWQLSEIRRVSKNFFSD